MAQKIICGDGAVSRLDDVLKETGATKLLLVCGSSFDRLPIKRIESVPYVRFDSFTPNPRYEDVCQGVERFRAEGCDAILAVGGGSAMDVAKCIKLYSNMDPTKNYLTQEPCNPSVPLIAIPTTAGTGSESTRFAVIYYEGKKQSVADDSILPDCVILDPALVKTLPLYQKKCTLLDALCQAIESWWSVNSSDESKEYAKTAVTMIMQHMNAYLSGDDEAAEKILIATNLAGQAINITQTTAPHAMSYKLTTLYRIPHGHAVAICLPKVWRAMLTQMDGCIDPRGREYLSHTFMQIAKALGAAAPEDAIVGFERMLRNLEIVPPYIAPEELDVLAESVNPVRLRNNPVAFTGAELKKIYAEISSKS